MKISVFFYSALAFVIISGVMFGLDWQPATLSPMAPIQVVALPPPPPPAPAVAPKPAVQSPVAANPAAPKVAAPSPAALSPAAPSPAAPSPAARSPAAPVAIAPAVPPVEPALPKALCDIAACAAAYRSFRESDCTFNPSFGPRQLCTKGVVPIAAATPASSDAPSSNMHDEPGRQTQPAAQPSTVSNIKCNVSACATAYRTFTASDCTFMASGGVRRLCTK